MFARKTLIGPLAAALFAGAVAVAPAAQAAPGGGFGGHGGGGGGHGGGAAPMASPGGAAPMASHAGAAPMSSHAGMGRMSSHSGVAPMHVSPRGRATFGAVPHANSFARSYTPHTYMAQHPGAGRYARNYHHGHHHRYRRYGYGYYGFGWGWPYAYDEYPYDYYGDYYVRCYHRHIRVRGHWVWRRYCRRYYY